MTKDNFKNIVLTCRISSILLFFLAFATLLDILPLFRMAEINLGQIVVLAMSLIVYMVLSYFIWKNFFTVAVIALVLFTIDLLLQIIMVRFSVFKILVLLSLIKDTYCLSKSRKKFKK